MQKVHFVIIVAHGIIPAMIVEGRERSPNPELFRGISLRNGYGHATEHTGKIIPITHEQYRGKEGEQSRRIIFEKLGVRQEPALLMSSPDGAFIKVGDTPELTWWAPHRAEREIIAQLAHALSSRQRPYVIDAGCGTGFLTKLFASEMGVRVTGLEVDEEKKKLFPASVENASIINMNVWDAVEHLAGVNPLYTAATDKTIKTALRSLRDEYEKDPPYFVYNGMCMGISEGDEMEKIARAISRLRVHSPVDIVFSSFMDKKSELTVPIRDGIHPKCIIYVRDILGQTGAGDYYVLKDDKNRLVDDLTHEMVSFNPGVHYRTAARWRTNCKNDWDSRKEEVDPDLGAEVIVQLRNDVVVASLPEIAIPANKWDVELEMAIGEKTGFFKGLQKAKQQLLAA